MASENHVYDLINLDGKRIGVCMPSREERKAEFVTFEGRVFIRVVNDTGHFAGQIVKYQEAVAATPDMIIYAR